jgi:hypothetical protein
VQAAKAPGVDVFQLKVAFMWKFIQFSEWGEAASTALESGSSADNNQAWRICFTSSGDQAKAAELLAGKRHRNKPIELVTLSETAKVAPCRILFVSAKDAQAFDLTNIPDSVPTIGEDSSFLSRGGLLNLSFKSVAYVSKLIEKK